jgi:HEAT repeat protein
LRALIVLVACGGVLVWTWRHASWESDHPAVGAVRALRDRNPQGRVTAIEDLESFGLADEMIAIPPLIARLKDEDTQVRAAAAKALGTILAGGAGRGSSRDTTKAGIMAIVRLLNDPKAAVRIAAIDALQRLPWAPVPVAASGRPAREIRHPRARIVPPVDPLNVVLSLSEALADLDPEVRLAAARAVGIVGPQVPFYASSTPDATADVKPDGERARTDPSARIPRFVDPFIPMLLRVLERDIPSVREACSIALAKLEPPAVTAAAASDLIVALGSRDRDVRYQAAGILGRLGPDAHPAVVALIAVTQEPVGVERLDPGSLGPLSLDPASNAALALGRIAPSSSSADAAVAALAELARSDRPGRRASAIQGLAEFGLDSRAIAIFATALADRDSAVRAAALRALAALGPKTSIDPPEALRAVLEDESVHNRAAAAAALATYQRGLDPFLPSLLRALEHTKDQRVRSRFSQAFYEIKIPAITRSAIPTLMASFGSQDREVRREATGLLGKLGPAAHTAVPLLIKTVVREAADSDTYDSSSGASEALGLIAPGTESAEAAISALIEVARAGSPARRAQAASALGQFGPAAVRAVPDLIRMLKEYDRRAAHYLWVCPAVALGRIAPGTPAADRALTALAEAFRANSAGLRGEVIPLLPGFGHSDAVIAILTDVLDSNSPIELEPAIRALEMLGPKASRSIPKLRELQERQGIDVRRAAIKAIATLEASDRPRP